MKGFKDTGNGPKSGHSFSSKKGFTGSTGKRQEVRSYSRSVPKKHKFAEGGAVLAGSSVVKRDKPVTDFDREHGGKSPVASGFNKGGMAKKGKGKDCYAFGGKVGALMSAIGRSGPKTPVRGPVAAPPRAVGVEAPARTTGFGSFGRNPLIGR